MNNDHRTENKPRVRPMPEGAEASARRARHAAEGAPTGSAKKPRPKKSQPSPETARRRAEKQYTDDAYYQNPRQAAPKKSAKKGRRPKKKNNWGKSALYSVIAIVCALVISFLIHTFLFQVILVSGDAMYSTLGDGDWVMVTKYDYWTRAPQRGDIVAVSVDGGVVLRRVVGMPGETVQGDGNGDTLVDGNPLTEPYVALKNYNETATTTLPGGRYYVMSDNRQVTLDSRDPSIGMITRQKIIGKAKSILLPLGRSGTIQ